MAKTKKEDLGNLGADPASKIEVIKNLIFGDNIAEYDSEFVSLKKDIDSKRKELKNYIDETRQELMTNIDNLSTDVNIRITDLENALEDKADQLDNKKVDRKLLGDLLISLGEKIASK
jgi:phenylalanyl-tRNA synthetase alpha subunit